MYAQNKNPIGFPEESVSGWKVGSRIMKVVLYWDQPG